MSTVPDRSELYRLLVALARSIYLMRREWSDPQPGDLVVEITGHRTDPDAIGWLLGHGEAPYHEDDPTDGAVPMRHVWDVLPLNPDAAVQTLHGRRFQRWENASFRTVDAEFLRAAGLERPGGVEWG